MLLESPLLPLSLDYSNVLCPSAFSCPHPVTEHVYLDENISTKHICTLCRDCRWSRFLYSPQYVNAPYMRQPQSHALGPPVVKTSRP